MKKYTASGCSDNPPSDQPGPGAAPGQVGIYRPPPGLHLLRPRGPLLLRRSFCSTRFEHRSYVPGGGGHHASRAQVPLSTPGAIIRTAKRLNAGQQHAAGTIASPPAAQPAAERHLQRGATPCSDSNWRAQGLPSRLLPSSRHIQKRPAALPAAMLDVRLFQQRLGRFTSGETAMHHSFSFSVNSCPRSFRFRVSFLLPGAANGPAMYSPGRPLPFSYTQRGFSQRFSLVPIPFSLAFS